MTKNNLKGEVLRGRERRRRWAAEKIAIVAETHEPGVTVSLVARRRGVAPSQVFSWRCLAAQGALTAAGAQEAFLGRFRSMQGATATVYSGHYTQASGFEAAKTLFAAPGRPTAVFAANDLVALGALGTAREQRLIAGVDFALCGYDDIEIAASGLISLTTMCYSQKEVCRIARELLQARCAEPTRPTRVVRLRLKLMVKGKSCECSDKTK